MFNYWKERPIQPNEVENSLHNIHALMGPRAQEFLDKHPKTDRGIISAYEEVCEIIFKDLLRH